MKSGKVANMAFLRFKKGKKKTDRKSGEEEKRWKGGSLLSEWKQVKKPSKPFAQAAGVLVISLLGAGICAIINSGMNELISLLLEHA